MEKSQRRSGIILSYAGQVVQMLTGLLYTPIMIRLLGQSEYGLYQLAYSIISYLGLLNFGFNAAYIRFYSKEKVQGDKEDVYRLNGMFMLIFLILSLVCLICGLSIIFGIRTILGQGYSEKEYQKIVLLMILMLVNMAISFPGTVFSCIIVAHERFVFNKTLSLVQSLLNPFITLPLLFMGYGSVAMAAISLLLTTALFIINFYYCLFNLKERFVFRGFRAGILKEMWFFTFFIFLNQIIDQINWNVDKFILGRLSGAVSVAVYSVSSQINLIYLQLSNSVSSVFIPEVNRIVAESNDNNKLSELFVKIGRIQFMIMTLVMTGLIFFGKSFIHFWAGPGYDESYRVALLLVVPVTVPLVQNIGIEIQRAKNKHKVRSWVYLVIALINVAISVPLVLLYGPTGAALGTALSLIVGNGVFMNWYYYKKLGIDIPLFWKKMIDFVPTLLIASILGFAHMFLVKQESVLTLICYILGYTMVFVVTLYYTGMNEQEKRSVLELLRKFAIRKG